MTDTKTAVATRDAARQEPKPPIKTGGALAALVPSNIDEAFRLAKALSSAGDMVPQHFQGKPEATMAAIVRGMEVGLNPMQALSSIAVINGRATIWGDAIPALLQRAGHHLDVEEEGEGDSFVAIATLTRGDTGKKIIRRFGIADAKRAGLLDKKGPWQQYRKRMCSHRARTWAARDGAADALMGMQVAEEVQDYGPDHARDITPEPQRTAPRRGGVMYREPEPVDEIHEAEPAETPHDEDGVVTEDEAMQGELLDADTSEVSAEDTAMLEKLSGTILEWINADASEEEVNSILAQFAPQLDQMKTALPDRHAAVMAAVEKKAAA